MTQRRRDNCKITITYEPSIQSVNKTRNTVESLLKKPAIVDELFSEPRRIKMGSKSVQRSVLCWEVVLFSEGPLSEVLL